MITIVLVVLLVLILAGLPTGYGYPHSWGYYPSGILTVLLIVLVVLALAGRI